MLQVERKVVGIRCSRCKRAGVMTEHELIAIGESYVWLQLPAGWWSLRGYRDAYRCNDCLVAPA